MKILGINDSHLATAALLIDGKLVSVVSEEKFTGVKNQTGFPVNAVKYCLEEAQISIDDLDYIAFAGEVASPLSFRDLGHVSNLKWVAAFKILYYIKVQVFEGLQFYLPFLKNIKEIIYCILYYLTKKKSQKGRIGIMKRHFKFDLKKVIFVEHHTCHAYSSLFSSGFPQEENEVLVLTADGEGDKLSSTVGVYSKGEYKRISKTSMNNSLGNFWYCTTLYLGMSPMEHEYKIMGLAPYGAGLEGEAIYQKLKPLFKINEDTLQIQCAIDSHLYTSYFYKKFKFKDSVRFDYLSFAVQKLTEEVLQEWVRAAVHKTKIKKIVCGGGVFMNVKVNQILTQMPEVEEIFFMPSSGDESNAIGACFWVYRQKFSQSPEKLKTLALGPSFSEEDIKASLRKNSAKVNFRKMANPSIEAAKLLQKGEIVAVFNGRTEFGARALGNRSILANPGKEGVAEIINKSIKNRDFWMPFAPVILEDRKKDYLKESGKTSLYYMMVTCNSTLRAQTELKGAMHSWDKTLRVQLVSTNSNSYFYQIVKDFEKLTKIGGLLNTSFNLHGEPTVSSPNDALRTFISSGLGYMFLENYLVTKV